MTTVYEPHVLPEVLGGVDLTDQSRFATGVPYDVFARLRREAPVLSHPPGHSVDGEPFWVLSRYADIAVAATDPVFSTRTGGTRTGGGTHLDDLEMGVHAGAFVAMMDDPRHRLVIDLVKEPMSASTATSLGARFRELAAEVIDAAVERGSCEFATDVAGPYAMRAVALAVGAPRSDWDQLVEWNRVVSNVTSRTTGTSDDPKARTVTAATFGYSEELVAAKRACPAHDIASALAVGEIPGGYGEGPVTGYERVLNVWLMLLTGSEQPRNTASGAVLALAQHPGQWRALREDRSLLDGAIEEALRWMPPNPYNRRTVTRDLDFRGVPMRAGDKVTLWWPSANRDEAVFPDPDTFDIRRHPNPHMAFGHGRYPCAGDHLGRAELRAFLDVLLDRVAEVRVTAPVTYLPSNKHTVVSSMPLELVPAAPTGVA
ncbi:MAG: cytochrome [Actinobacteria bacterium 13_2_20CM_2_71_6]|nr:MAG: cytochrome [Actinobacteria bacterium 13_2_20CM_2_71_6]